MVAERALALSLDTHAARAAMSALAELAERRLQAVERFLGAGHSLFEIRRANAVDDVVKAVGGETSDEFVEVSEAAA